MQTDQKSTKLPAGPHVAQSPALRLIAAGIGKRSTRSPVQIACQFGESLYLSSATLGEAIIPCSLALHEDHSAGHAAAADRGGPDREMLSSLQLRPPIRENICGHISDACSSKLPLKLSPDAGLTASLPAPPTGYGINQWVRSDTQIYALMESEDSSAARHRLICCSELGKWDKWEHIHLPVTPDTPTQFISHLAILDTKLYVTLDDEILGFQLWRCAIAEGVPCHWEKIIDQGGYQHSANAHVTAIHSTSEQLLIACAGNRHLSQLKERPIAAELIMVSRDDSWGLLVGTTRLTPQGLLVPRGAMGRGFDAAGASIITSITRYGVVFLVVTQSLQNNDEKLNGQVWSSEDLRTWTELTLPAELGRQNGTLVGALQTAFTTIYLIEQKPSPAQENCEEAEERAGTDMDTQLLPCGMEIWLDESVN